MQFNLPVVPITDLAVHKREKELVVATQGRSFWILDDLPLLHQMMDAGGFSAAAETQLFKPKDSYRMPGGGGVPLPADCDDRSKSSERRSRLLFVESKTDDRYCARVSRSGRQVDSQVHGARAHGSRRCASSRRQPPGEEGGFGGGGRRRVPTDVGLNRFVWDMRYPDAVRFPGMILWAGETRGPRMRAGNLSGEADG